MSWVKTGLISVWVLGMTLVFYYLKTREIMAFYFG